MLIFTPLCFHLCWMLTLDLMLFPRSATAIQLDMADKSVDDMYDGCNDSMKIILDQKFSGEKGDKDWKNCSRSAEKILARRLENKALTKEHLQAICMYTGRSSYAQINKAIREQKNKYGTLFKYHILHFYLTSAIQILKPNKQCYTTYRRSNITFEGRVGDTIRFGSFASSSTEMNVYEFGSETCFNIETCLGANVSLYSKHEEEREVLIPPYETFTIMNRIPKYSAPVDLTDCKVIYELKHAGNMSNLNCKVYKMFSVPSRAHRFECPFKKLLSFVLSW